MSWKGILIGGALGGLHGGILGGLLGAVLGHQLERRFAGRKFAVPRFRTRLDDAYSLLGVSPSADDDTVKSAYRTLAKRYHPDLLKASGASDAEINRATQIMSKVNSAWKLVKSSRGI